MSKAKDKPKQQEERKWEPYYYITLFRLRGHETWRAHLGSYPDTFARQAANDKWPEILETKVHRVNRITGTIEIMP